MKQLQLRMERRAVAQVADAVERDIEAGGSPDDLPDLQTTLAWLRYRLAKARPRQDEDRGH